MQELMDYLNEDEFTGICDIRDRIEELLEKEKEQIIQAHGLKYYDIGEVTITGENYYNQNYNQIKR